jgi:hypothetical protein
VKAPSFSDRERFQQSAISRRPKFAICPVADGNCSRAISLSMMEYRGTEYQVVQTSNPTGWKWTVEVVGRRIRTGSGYSRVAAIALAQRAIDKLLNSPASKAVPPASMETP